MFKKRETAIPPGRPMGLVEAARLRCDRILSKIFSPAHLGSGIDAAAESPTLPLASSVGIVGLANKNVLSTQHFEVSVEKKRDKMRTSGKSRSPITGRAKRSPKRQHSSQDGGTK